MRWPMPLLVAGVLLLSFIAGSLMVMSCTKKTSSDSSTGYFIQIPQGIAE